MAIQKQLLYDIVIIGGGLAGVCASIAAIRELRKLKTENPRVALINDRPVLGGVSSSEIRVPPIGAGRNPWGYEMGVISELLYEERSRNHNRWEMGTANSIWDIILWEKVKAEKGLELFLNTSVRNVKTEFVNDKKTINSVSAYQLGNETEYTFSAKQFIDCSGDSTVAFEAGAELITGRESKEKFNETLANENADDACMGSSLLFQAKDMGRPCPFKAPQYAAKYHTEKSLFFRPHQNFKNGYYWIEVGVPFKTIDQNEEIRDELIKHVLGVWDHLKNHCTLFGKEVENWALDWVGMIPGKRGSRRIVGDTIVTEHDLRNMRLFEDRVAFGGHFFDLHTIGGILANDKPGNPVDTDPNLWDRCRLKPYPLPLSALYSKNIDNLYMAGRNISTSHIANGSTRVMLTNALLGQAVGTAAAMSVWHQLSPREIRQQKINEVQQSLLRQGCTLHGIKNQDQKDLALQSKVSASSECALHLEPIENENPNWLSYRHKMEFALGSVIPISTAKIEKVELWLESEDTADCEISLSLYVLEHLWDIQSEKKSIIKVKQKIKAGYKGFVSFELNQVTEPNRFYFITTESTQAKIYWRFRRNHPTGVFSVFQSPTSGFWKYLRHQRVEGFETFCLKISPEQYPFHASNVISGETRPFYNSNIWVSENSNLKPQWLKLNWLEPVNISQIELTFDTDLSLTNETMPEFYISPLCVKNYEIFYLDKNNKQTKIVSIEGNYQRKRIHSINSIATKELEIRILSTNGDAKARVYEVRVY
jgi:hypothetical protein